MTPILFAIVAVFCLKQTCVMHPHETIVGAITVLVGLPIYWYASRTTGENPVLRNPLPDQSL